MATAASTLSDIKSSQTVTQQSESYARLIHAAAVNGDKATLQKILKGLYRSMYEWVGSNVYCKMQQSQINLLCLTFEPEIALLIQDACYT